MTFSYKMMASPVGELKLVASERGLSAILWENDDPARVRLGPLVENDSHPILIEAERQIGEYFAGTRKAFELPLDFQFRDELATYEELVAWQSTKARLSPRQR